MATKTTTRKPAAAAAKPAAAKAKPAPAAAPEVAATPTAPTNCKCGCGQPTIAPKAQYLSGHDARHAGQVGRVLIDLAKKPGWAGESDENRETAIRLALQDLPTGKLQDKARGMLATYLAKQAKAEAARKAREAAKAAAKAAYEAAMAKA